MASEELQKQLQEELEKFKTSEKENEQNATGGRSVTGYPRPLTGVKRRTWEMTSADHSREYQKAVGVRKQLDAQLNENNMVKEELDLLESDGKVFKMMGPALIQQDVGEATATVQKRIQYITGEIKRHDTMIKDLEKKQETHRDKLSKLQQEFSKAHMKMGAVKT